MAKIKVCMCESYTTITAKEWVEIDSDMYEETKGMSAEELQDYIQENYTEIKPTPSSRNMGWLSTLSDELDGMDIINDKIKNEDHWLEFEDVSECEDCDEDFDVSEEEE
jgi:hypothetical protein